MKEFFLWVFLYGTVYSITEIVFYNPWITAAAMCIYTALLVFNYVRKYYTKGQYFVFTEKRALFIGILFAFAVLNLIYFDGITFSAKLVIMVLAAVCEEIFFRGYLLSFLKNKGALFAILVNGVVFSLYHLISGGDFLQAICAFSIGFAFSAYKLKYGDLLLCILAHGAVNITGEADINVVAAVICSMVTVVCGYFLYRTKEK